MSSSATFPGGCLGLQSTMTNAGRGASPGGHHPQLTQGMLRLQTPRVSLAPSRQSFRLNAAPERAFIDVCTNKTCVSQGSGDVFRVFQEIAGSNVDIAECGCLGNCGKGPNVEFLLPGEEGEVLNGIATIEDAAAILESRCGGTPADQAIAAYKHKVEGDALVGKDDFKGAVAAYSKALELDTTGLVLANRAKVRLQLGETKAAVEDAEAACDAKPTWAPAQLVAAEVYEQLKDQENTLRCLSNAYNLDEALGESTEFRNRVAWAQDMHLY